MSFDSSNSAFNPDTFLDQTTTSAGASRPPISAGLDFLGVIGTPKARSSPGKKDPSQTYIFCDIPITVDLSTNPSEANRVGTDKVTLRHSGSIDYKDGTLDWSTGKNMFLLGYREALGLNQDGSSFSPRMLEGRVVRVRIGQRQGTDTDPLTGRPRIYDEVAAITRV